MFAWLAGRAPLAVGRQQELVSCCLAMGTRIPAQLGLRALLPGRQSPDLGKTTLCSLPQCFRLGRTPQSCDSWLATKNLCAYPVGSLFLPCQGGTLGPEVQVSCLSEFS